MKKKKNQNLNLESYVKLLRFFFVTIIVCSIFACNGGAENLGENKIDSVSKELKAFNDAIEKDSNNAENYYKRSIYLYQNQRYADAIEDIGKAINLEPENPLYHFKIGEYLFAINQTKKAALAFEKAVALKPDYTEALQKLGELYMIVKEYGKSDSCWHTLYILDKTNSKASYSRGLMYKDKGDTAKAIQAFQYTTELDAKFTQPQLQLGIIYAARKNPLCLAYFDAVLKENPKSWEVYLARGDYYMRKGMNAMAMKDFDLVLYYNKMNFMANYNAGVILCSENKYQKASDQFSNVIDKNPEYTYAYFSRALCHVKLQEKALAIADLEYLLHIDSTFAEAKNMLKELRP